MIRHVSTRREDRVSDARGCLRLFGGVFVLTGSFALGAALLGWGGADTAAAWERVGLAALGASHLSAGLWVGWGRSVSSVARRSGVTVTERWPFRRDAVREIAPGEVAEVAVYAETDSEGDDVFGVALRLRSGERVPLTRQLAPLCATAEAAAEAVARRIGAPLALLPATGRAPVRLAPEAVEAV